MIISNVTHGIEWTQKLGGQWDGTTTASKMIERTPVFGGAVDNVVADRAATKRHIFTLDRVLKIMVILMGLAIKTALAGDDLTFPKGTCTGDGVDPDLVIMNPPRISKDGKDGLHLDFGVNHQIFKDGRIYRGMFRNGQPNGYGIMNYPGGACYQGQWRNGKRHGQGVFLTTDGTRYDGEWRNDLLEGHDVPESAAPPGPLPASAGRLVCTFFGTTTPQGGWMNIFGDNGASINPDTQCSDRGRDWECVIPDDTDVGSAVFHFRISKRALTLSGSANVAFPLYHTSYVQQIQGSCRSR